MKIAFFSPKPFSYKLGATKNRMELAGNLEKLGWETHLVDKDQVMGNREVVEESYNEALKKYLIRHAHKYDVVLYEYNSLPFNRNLFCEKTVFVARPALLFFSDSQINNPVDLRTRLSLNYHKILTALKINSGSKDKNLDREKITSLEQSDVIQVQNRLDAALLIKKGFDKNKIIVVPNGITEERSLSLRKDRELFQKYFTIAFIGTFDFRKGAMDFPFIVKNLLKKYPDCRFKFIGTKGLYSTADQVLNFFSKKFQKSIEVIPTFEPEELPEILRECQIGIFPSYLESFGFGALEMMCAGLPVVSYNIPGPSDFILKDLLVPVGNKSLMVEKVLNLMEDEAELKRISLEARDIADEYSWSKIALTTSLKYLKHIKKRNPGYVSIVN